MNPPLFQSALRDENGQGDIAYISMGALGLAVLGPILVMTWLDAYVVMKCEPKQIVLKDSVTLVECKYDPQPLGTAIGLACGGFGVLLGALAGYMAATRKPAGSSTTTTRTQETVVAAPVPGPVGAPIPVAVVDMPAATAPPQRPVKRARKRK